MVVIHAMRAMVAHRASMVVVNTAPSMVAVSTIGTLNAENTSVGSLVAVSTVGNLNAVNIPVGSLVAANIPAGSTVAASIVNVVAMASIATERERQRWALCQQTLRHGTPVPESRLAGARTFPEWLVDRQDRPSTTASNTR